MTSTKGLASMINDTCRSIVVLILNGIFNVCHEILKFSLILFLVYYMWMWIFRFWDAVLDGTLPSASQFLPQIETDPHRNLIQKYELHEEINETQSDFENFIKAELRDSNLSVGIKPRSSQFEHQATASLNKSAKHQRTQESEVTPKLGRVTSQQSIKESYHIPRSLAVPIHSNPNSEALNIPNRSDHSFDSAVKLKKETDAQKMPSYDDSTNREIERD